MSRSPSNGVSKSRVLLATVIAGGIVTLRPFLWPFALATMGLLWFITRSVRPTAHRGRRVGDVLMMRVRRPNGDGGLVLLAISLYFAYDWYRSRSVGHDGGVTGWLALLIGVFALYQLAAYWIRTDLTLRIGPLIAGGSAEVTWEVSAPTVVFSQVKFLVRERVIVVGPHEPRVVDITIYEQELENSEPARGSSIFELPAFLPPPQLLSSARIEWLVEVTVTPAIWPKRTIDLPLDVSGAEGRPSSIETVPARSTGGDVVVDLERTHVAAGELLRGTIAWNRDAPPSGQLVLQWEISGESSHVEAVGLVPLADLPRLPGTAEGGPYRGLPANDRVPLEARDKRRFQFAMPTQPWSYAGTNMVLTWCLVATVDSDELHVPLRSGPDNDDAWVDG